MLYKSNNAVLESLTPAQAYFLACDKKFMWFCAGRGCFLKGTKIQMFDGSTKLVEDIQRDDVIIGDDKTPRYVMSTVTGVDEAYRVQLDDDSYFDCNIDHKCVVVDELDNEKIKELSVRELLKLDLTFLKQIRIVNNQPEKRSFKLFCIGRQPYFGFQTDNNNRFLLDNGVVTKQSGKCFGKDTEFLMFDGSIKKVQDLVIGDVLMGWDNTPRKILSTCQGIDELYEIKPHNGGKSHIVNSFHNLVVKTYDNSLSLEQSVPYDINLQSFLLKSYSERSKSVIFKAKTELPHVDALPMHPFSYGRALSGADLIDNKYLYSSLSQRRLLLSGIISKIGSLDINNDVAAVYSSNQDFLHQVCLLSASCGESSYIHDDSVLINLNESEHSHYGFDIISLGEGDYYGFTVEGDGRVLLADFTVTRNTTIGSMWVYKNVIRYPKSRGLIAANSYHQLHGATIPPILVYFRKIGLDFRVNKRPPESWLQKTDFEMANYKNIITVETGAHIFIRSLDNFDLIRGLEVGWAWIDEIASSEKEAWDVVVGCLRDKNSKELHIRVTGTPDGANHYTWQEFKKKWDNDPKIAKDYDIVFMSARENPFLPEGFLDGMLASYDSRKALQEVDGRILADQAANYYYEWRPDCHKRVMQAYDPHKPLILCWDFNSSKTSPMSMVICQKGKYGNGTEFVQVIDEIVIPAGNTPAVCEKFIQKYYSKHQSSIYVYGDRSGNNSSTGTSDFAQIEERLKPKFPDFHLRIFRSNMKVNQRQAAVNGLLRNSYGIVRLYISPDCIELCTDMDKVQPDKFGGIDKSDPARTHTSDALGYFIAREFPVVIGERNGVKSMGAVNLSAR